jgi:hypothetical protein
MPKSNTESDGVQVSDYFTVAQRAVLRVGDGRGFVVEHRNHLGWSERIIITAAHVIAHAALGDGTEGLPSCHPARYLNEETYPRLLGPLGSDCTVWAQFLFVDPIADIAVLTQPDNQELPDEAEAYDALVDGMHSLVIADAPGEGTKIVDSGGYRFEALTPGTGPARVLSLTGDWLTGKVMRFGAGMAFEPGDAFAGGMSGSPIIDTQGRAIGVVSCDMRNPVILDSLSAWLVRRITACVAEQQ